MSDEEQAVFWIVGSILVALYMLPSIVAFARGHANRWLILVLNIVFGGTGLGWLGCLVWSFHAIHRTADPQGSHGGESGLNLAVNDPVRITFAPEEIPVSSVDHRISRLERLKRLRDEAVLDEAEFKKLARTVMDQPSSST